jgi:hypothetical protein
MNFLRRIFGLRSQTSAPPLPSPPSDKVNAFLNGSISALTSADIDPENTERYQGYERAMRLKKDGMLNEAALILEESCQPPSIYCGHYRELFQIYRSKNREDIKSGNFSQARDRVVRMIRYDDEMISMMTDHYSERQGKKLSKSTFDGSRNLKITDAKALRSAADALGDKLLIRQATKYIVKFNEKKNGA